MRLNRRVLIKAFLGSVAILKNKTQSPEEEIDGILEDFARRKEQEQNSSSQFYISLHTSWPIQLHQDSNEVDYRGYKRIAVPRTDEGWSVIKEKATNVRKIDFPQCPPGKLYEITHLGVGFEKTGRGKLLYKGGLSNRLLIGGPTHVTPLFAPGDLTITADELQHDFLK